MGTENFSQWLIIIPARMGSTRLPFKVKLDLCGKPLIVRVYENLKPLLKKGLSIIVATDAQEVVALCHSHKIPSFLTKKKHLSGTDRCFEVAEAFRQSYILNVQGDEPFLDREDLLKIIKEKESLDKGEILTLASLSFHKKEQSDPSIVKLIPKKNRAHSFARVLDKKKQSFYHHLGVYAYHRETLKTFCSLKPSFLEKKLKLEQMRALENGIRIKFIKVKSSSFGIDTMEDLVRARKIFSLQESDKIC